MTNMTMGQRIAAQRKLKAMSQEALAEQLEVSRQAVSKWESDGAIPEVDKLIALGRIFGVSVGWLLGTESECRYDPEAGLNAAQTEMVEQIVERCRPPKGPLWPRITAAVCAAAVLLAAGLHYQRRIDGLTADNMTTQSQLAHLTQENQQIRAQLDAMEALLQKQEDASKLLDGCSVHSLYTSEDMKTVYITFALSPRVYQEALEAKLVVTESSGQGSTACRWDGTAYLCRIGTPLEDGQVFSFRLEGEDSWREESLNDWEPMLGALRTCSAFFVDPTDPLAAELNAPFSRENTVYTFGVRLFPPVVQPRSSFAFQELVFTLYHNDTPIWTMDWREDFQSAHGAHQAYALPVAPDIRAELPQLTAGDTLRLELKTVLTGGQERLAVLDTRTVE